MCDEQWTEQAELLAIYLAEQFGVCPHCGSVNLESGVLRHTCPVRPYVFCKDCKKALA
jgi:hypothetical protein